MLPFKLVVFDMAGTTVQDHQEVENCFLEACELSSLNCDSSTILKYMGWHKIQVFQILWRNQLGGETEEFEKSVAKSYKLFTEILERHYLTQPVLPTEGALETFDWLRSQGVKIALTTGFYRKVTDIILARLGWYEGLNEQNINGKIIDASISSDEVEAGRPTPHMIQRAMQLLDIQDTKQVINIGDTPSDLASGFNANCLLSVALTNGTHSAEQLGAVPHDHLFADMNEFRLFLQKEYLS
jgi:phosphonatase-like hydrolase